MVKAESEPVSEKELEEESDIEEIVEKDEKSFRDKDGAGYGDLMTTNVMPNLVNTDSETYVGKPAPSNNQTYIEESKSNNMVDANKLTHTRVGDYINFYQNGVQDSGVVAKMGSAFITIFKEDGSFHNVHINDTFFVSDILVNKTWNDMDMEERAEQLMKVKAYSPRYLSKTWEQLPKELQSVLKSDQEQGAYGNIGGRPNVGISTDTDIDADDDYEGNSHDDIQVENQFQHDATVPKTDKDPVKKAGEFVYTDNPKVYKVPEQTQKGYGMKYGVKYISEEDSE